MNRAINSNALLLEDFDIVNMQKCCPDETIGVNVNRIYIQIAKYGNNPKRAEELKILSNAISNIGGRGVIEEPKYVPMKVCDVTKCFRQYLKKLPKRTFKYL